MDDMTTMRTSRRQVLEWVAGLVPAAGEDCVRVAVDGVDGAGKTTFADELGEILAQRRPVVRVSADDFLNPRAVRHRRGRHSPEGFWLDSYDYPALIRDVLRPLGPGGDRRYRGAAHDLASDQQVTPQWAQAPAGAVLLLDGLFLHRDELAGLWGFSVFLRVPFEVTAARMADRDGSHPDPDHASMIRYVEGQRLYFAACDPVGRAGVVVDNTDPQRPALLTR